MGYTQFTTRHLSEHLSVSPTFVTLCTITPLRTSGIYVLTGFPKTSPGGKKFPGATMVQSPEYHDGVNNANLIQFIRAVLGSALGKKNTCELF